MEIIRKPGWTCAAFYSLLQRVQNARVEAICRNADCCVPVRAINTRPKALQCFERWRRGMAEHVVSATELSLMVLLLWMNGKDGR